ncbi:MAG: VWA domain-containing protein [Planctomycetaceae bacterium]
MGRRLLLLLVPALAVLAGDFKLKDLLEPNPEAFPLRPYPWESWEELDGDTKKRAKGLDPAEWTEPPPDPPDEEKDKKEKKPEPPPGAPAPPKYPPERHPGFKFEERLAEKAKAFDALVPVWSPSMVEGLVKQLDRLEKGADQWAKLVREVAEEYIKVKELYDDASETYARNYEKQHGKRPDSVLINRALADDFHRKSKRLQEVVSLQQSERHFHIWLEARVAQLVGELSEKERLKPLAALEAGLEDKDWRQRLRCGAILARMGAEGEPTLRAAIAREEDPTVLGAHIRAVAKLGGETLLALLGQRLDDPAWQVRAAVIAELARIRRKESVDLLVARFPKEEGRLRDDLNAALARLTGRRMDPDAEAWRLWWEKAREGWNPPAEGAVGEEAAGQAKEGVVYFYGIRTSSKRIVFCIDISGSMDFPLDGQGGKKPPRMESAKRELLQALAALPEEALFSIVAYNATVSEWKRKPVLATPNSKQEARKFVEKLQPAGATNIYDALTLAMDVAAGGNRTKEEADTIFFLTDGQPTHGRIVDAAQILEEITARNKLLGLVIHTIGVSKEQNAGFLLNLAKRNGGEYVARK